MLVTFQIRVAPGRSLAATLYPRGATVPAISSVALTEVIPAVYQAQVNLPEDTWYTVLVYQGTRLMMITDLHHDGAEGIKICGEAPTFIENAVSDAAELLARIATQVLSGQVLMIPAHVVDTTNIYGYCLEFNQTPRVGVTVQFRIRSGVGHDVYPMVPKDTVTDSTGRFVFQAPRTRGLVFEVRAGTGEWRRFPSADVSEIHLPFTLG